MTPSLWLSLIGALALFWGIGAYNRLMRLRVAAITTFAPLQKHYEQCVTLVLISFGGVDEAQHLSARAGLLGAANQLSASLQAAQLQPLDSSTLRALETAHGTLFDCWSRVSSEPADLAGAALPETLQQHWQHLVLQVGEGQLEFNGRVQTYNHAIGQFPASWLARVFGFQSAHVLKSQV